MTALTLARNLRTPMLWLAGARAVLGILAVPIAPLLYREHFVVLVLLRPTKEVLLVGGFLARRGDVNPLSVLVAAVPLALLGVWHFYWLGRAFSKEIQTGKGLPRFADKLLPTDRIEKLCRVLDHKGKRVVLIGRLAAFPSALLAAAAGASGMRSRDFLRADLAGGVLAIAEVFGAGYILGEAHKRAGPWLTAVGVALLCALLLLVGRSISRQPD